LWFYVLPWGFANITAHLNHVLPGIISAQNLGNYRFIQAAFKTNTINITVDHVRVAVLVAQY
jgi:hypothetical protein